jgi:hypothetical protein
LSVHSGADTRDDDDAVRARARSDDSFGHATDRCAVADCSAYTAACDCIACSNNARACHVSGSSDTGGHTRETGCCRATAETAQTFGA